MQRNFTKIPIYNKKEWANSERTTASQVKKRKKRNKTMKSKLFYKVGAGFFLLLAVIAVVCCGYGIVTYEWKWAVVGAVAAVCFLAALSSTWAEYAKYYSE